MSQKWYNTINLGSLGVAVANYFVLNSWNFLDGTLGFMWVLFCYTSLAAVLYLILPLNIFADFTSAICSRTSVCSGTFSPKCSSTSAPCSWSHSNWMPLCYTWYHLLSNCARSLFCWPPSLWLSWLFFEHIPAWAMWASTWPYFPCGKDAGNVSLLVLQKTHPWLLIICYSL